MPLQLPTLDDRSFEQLLAEAKRRIPVHTPEWTNFEGESDPGITIVEVFAFLAEALIYRANRVPELNRLKFLELLDIPLQPAAAAQGLVTIIPNRGPTQAVPLDSGVIVAAGKVRFLTTGGLTVLPIEARAYYKQPIPPTDPNYGSYAIKYAAVLAAAQSASDDQANSGDAPASSASAADSVLGFYQTLPVPLPTASDPNPSLSLVSDTVDRAIYLALLAPVNVDPDTVRAAIGGKTLSIGVVPALADATVAPLEPLVRQNPTTIVDPGLVFEIANATGSIDAGASYNSLQIVRPADVLNSVGVVQVVLPSADKLTTWQFSEPLVEGTGDFPPQLADDQVAARLITWVRLRLPAAAAIPPSGASNQPATSSQSGSLDARLTWVGVNATGVIQAIPVVNESLGTGAPDQTVTLANTPLLLDSIRLQVQDVNGVWQDWRLVDDLLSAGMTDMVYAADPESGVITFGDGLNGARPGPGSGIRASYQFGGSSQGNVAAGGIQTSPDPRLQGTFLISNPIATWGGTDGETADDGQKRIPLYLRHRDRLVTEQDFIDVTQRAAGVDVGRVEVLPLYRPPTTDLPNPPAQVAGVVTVLVIPARDAQRPLWPLPDRLFLQKVCDWLGPRRLVTTELFVRGPLYVPIYLSIGVEVLPGNFRDVVSQAVISQMQSFLSSLPPGGPDGLGWPLNKQVMSKELEAVADRVQGVDFVDSVLMGFGDNPAIAVDTVVLTNLQLPLLVRVNVVQGQPVPLSQLLGAAQAPPSVLPVPVTRSKC
jgi:hypothetical protein